MQARLEASELFRAPRETGVRSPVGRPVSGHSQKGSVPPVFAAPPAVPLDQKNSAPWWVVCLQETSWSDILLPGREACFSHLADIQCYSPANPPQERLEAVFPSRSPMFVDLVPIPDDLESPKNPLIPLFSPLFVRPNPYGDEVRLRVRPLRTPPLDGITTRSASLVFGMDGEKNSCLHRQYQLLVSGSP